MKNARIFFSTAFWAITLIGNAQTIYVPNGTSGIGASTNGNVGIGTSTPLGKFSIIDGQIHVNSPGNGTLTIDDASTAIIVGPKSQRNPTIGMYYPGIGFNHLLNYSGALYNLANHAWIGLRLVSTPGSEQSDLVFATKEGTDFTSRPIERMCIKYNGNIGIGLISPSHPLTVKPATDIDAISWRRSIDGNEVGRLGVTGGSGTGRYGWIGLWNANGIQSFQIDAGGGSSYLVSGNVGIGTTDPKNKLDVNGTIHAREVKVDLLGWADFVFTPTYKLRPLSEVEQFIKTNGHLPEIPKAEDVQQNGVNLGEMQTMLLQKVEELTLYILEQRNLIEKQQKEIDELKKIIK
jgi:hypothetical protein